MLIQLPFSYRLHYLNAFFFFFSDGLALQSKGDDFPFYHETMRNTMQKKKEKKEKGIKDKLGGGDALFGWAACSAKTLGGDPKDFPV